MSKDDLDNMTPVRPPTVNKNRNPKPHSEAGRNLNFPPLIVAIQLKTFTPVGTAIIMVADVK